MIIKSGNRPFLQLWAEHPRRTVTKRRGPEFPPATNNVAPSYFHRKIEER